MLVCLFKYLGRLDLKWHKGDVWNVQPAPKDHVWRTMKNPLGGGNGMVPHYSGTTLDAQARYASGAKSILENYLTGKPQDPANVIIGIGMYFPFLLSLYSKRFHRQVRDKGVRSALNAFRTLYIYRMNSSCTLVSASLICINP